MGEVTTFQAGWSISRLADEFGLDRRTVAKRLRDAHVQPCGKRGGSDVYRLADAAPALVDRALADPEQQQKNPRDLPPMERRAFYQSENERLKVEVSTGALIPAPEVEADYAALVKVVAQFFDTLPDVLERDAGLTGEQVERVQEACDRVRQAIYEKVVSDDVRDSG
jgi:hypothetical protein